MGNPLFVTRPLKPAHCEFIRLLAEIAVDQYLDELRTRDQGPVETSATNKSQHDAV